MFLISVSLYKFLKRKVLDKGGKASILWVWGVVGLGLKNYGESGLPRLACSMYLVLDSLFGG